MSFSAVLILTTLMPLQMGDPVGQMITDAAAQLNNPNHARRITAVRRLAAIEDRRTIEPLLDAIDDDHFLVRRTAAGALVRLKPARASRPLALRLLREEHFTVQIELLRGLRAIQDRSIRPYLLRAYPRLHRVAVPEAQRTMLALGIAESEFPSRN